MSYLLTINSEPDTPIRLSQTDFDMIYQAGLETINVGDSKANDMVDFATLETENNAPFMFKDMKLSDVEAAVGFAAGIQVVLQEVLSHYKKVD